MKITFFDTNVRVCDELKKRFAGFSEITVCNKKLEELDPHDALVTAGNSYAIMSGGIDYYVRNMLGIEFQDRVQEYIAMHYGGRLPVGCNLTITWENERFNNIIYAPTMEKPKEVVPNDIAVVFYNILKTCIGAKIETVACCGLGTGAGRLSPEVHAKILLETYVLFNEFEMVKP